MWEKIQVSGELCKLGKKKPGVQALLGEWCGNRAWGEKEATLSSIP